jgi:hypothetical protein
MAFRIKDGFQVATTDIVNNSGQLLVYQKDTTTIGQNLSKIADVSDVSFIRINANETVNALSAADFRAAIGAATDYGSQTANTVFAAPNGSTGNPTFRALVSADIPSLSYLPLSGGTITGDLTVNETVTLSGSITQANTLLNGIAFDSAARTYTDDGTAGTRATAAANSFGTPTLSSTNLVTVTTAATVYIAGAPAAGTNTTIPTSYALWVDSGTSKFDGDVSVDGTLNVRTAIDLADNDILRFGTSDDWEMYHNGTNNIIDLTVGDLLIRDDGTASDPTRFTFERTTGNFITGGDIEIQGGDLTTNQTTFNLINTSATTINAFGAANTIAVATVATDTISNVSRTSNVATITTSAAHGLVEGDVVSIECSDTTFNNSFVTLSSGTTGSTIVYPNSGGDVASTAATGTVTAGITTVKNNLKVEQDVLINKTLSVDKKLTVSGNTETDLVTITQTGTGLALRVEDSENPDTTPFAITASGQVGIGSIPSDAVQLSVGGSGTTNTQSNALLVRTIARPENNTVFSLVRTWSYTADNGGTAYTIGNLNHFAVQKVTWSADSTVTNQRGFSVETTFQGATNNYAFHARNPAGSTNWAFYADQATSYYGGNVIVNVTDDTNAALRVTQLGAGHALLVEDTTNPDSSPFVVDAGGRVSIGGDPLSTAGLHVPRDISAQTGYAVNVVPTITAAEATDTFAIRTVISTSASGTVGNVYDFAAIGGTNGGVSATNHYGFFVGQTLSNIGGNTYGFYSNLNSGSDRWAFYGNGTAPSYFGGSVTIASDLIVMGTTTTVNSTTITLDDPVLRLGGDTSTVESTKDRGIEALWDGTQLTLTNVIGNGTTTITVTVANTAGYAPGDLLTVTDASGTHQSKFNGTWKIATVPNATTFTVVVAQSVGTATYSTDIGTWVKSKVAFFGLDQSTGNLTFIPQANNTDEVFTGTVGTFAGNSSTATTLQTSRTINGTSFNGSANITTANWGTSRTITIGGTGKSVNGSAGVSWTLAEIGALPVAGGTLTGELKLGDGDATELVNLSAQLAATVTTTSATSIDTWAAATYRSCEYFVQVTQSASTAEYYTSKIMIIHDGTTTYMTEYAVIETGTIPVTFTTDINGGNVRLIATVTDADTRNAVIKLHRTLITV